MHRNLRSQQETEAAGVIGQAPNARISVTRVISREISDNPEESIGFEVGRCVPSVQNVRTAVRIRAGEVSGHKRVSAKQFNTIGGLCPPAYTPEHSSQNWQ